MDETNGYTVRQRKDARCTIYTTNDNRIVRNREIRNGKPSTLTRFISAARREGEEGLCLRRRRAG